MVDDVKRPSVGGGGRVQGNVACFDAEDAVQHSNEEAKKNTPDETPLIGNSAGL